MADQLTKLRPDRDLQCYFQEPSAVAALSNAGAHGFTVSGCWREQSDWAVVEWSRDNVFEHPALRNLPDGDLGGLQLSYEETRTNCLAMDSTTYDAVGWSYLRIWEESDAGELYHEVHLKNHATAVSGDYTPATAQFELQGTPTSGDYVELAWLDQHWNHLLAPDDTLATAIASLAEAINTETGTHGVEARATGPQITLTYQASAGANGNRVGVYGTVHGAATELWSPAWAMFAGGESPQRWRVNLDFNELYDTNQQRVNPDNVRKLRWTWAADLQFGNFQRSEFAVELSNWQVTGMNLAYSVAGPGSRRIEDTSADVTYTGSWAEPGAGPGSGPRWEERGNYSGGSIRHTTQAGDHFGCTYTAGVAHTLFLGTRYTDNGGQATVQVDSNPPVILDLKRSLEDWLIRIPLGQLSGAAHTVTVTHTGTNGTDVYFDFLEVAVPTAVLPSFASYPTTTLATDWDTNHSIAIAPERTAWLIDTLGFRGRANHYAGAMWFYELLCRGNSYASGTITFAGAPQFGGTTVVTLAGWDIKHVNLIGDTAESIARCFELLIAPFSTVWAQSAGDTLTLTARAMGTGGNTISIAATTGNEQFTATVSGTALSGGADGTWLTDLTAVPRMNRAARDWSRSYFGALRQYGIDGAAAFSMELRHGDDSAQAGIAQRYTDKPCWLNTPALQTNFSPASTAFWKQVYLDMAAVMTDAGVTPYLQFGEVQWWYFGDTDTNNVPISMPFYDDYTKTSFQAAYERPMAVIPSENADPALYSQECAFLPGLIGAFTQAIMSFVRQTYPQTRFEVLYPPDTNNTLLNQKINYPTATWTPANLECLKTENFTYTGNRNLNQARQSIKLPQTLSFPLSKSSHLVGIGDYTTPWSKERRLATGAGLESVVLFALDQFCLIGYGLPLDRGPRRALRMGR